MWPFQSSNSSKSSGSGADELAAPSRAASSPGQLDPRSLEVTEGADGVAKDVPVITYTEKVIAEKEDNLRKYIQDSYAKLHAVEKELEALRLEVKLTSGSKKAALELLRQKIEESAEKIKAARVKEQQAKQAWEAALKVVEQEEEHKHRLCDDLKTMIQESALQQFERLEALTQKLDALNPEMRGAALTAIEGLRAQIAPHGVPVLNGTPDTPSQQSRTEGDAQDSMGSSKVGPKETSAVAPASAEAPRQSTGDSSSASAPSEANASERETDAAPAAAKETSDRGSGQGPKKERGGIQLKGQVGKGKGGVVSKGQRATGAMGLNEKGGWTGAGFDVDTI